MSKPTRFEVIQGHLPAIVDAAIAEENRLREVDLTPDEEEVRREELEDALWATAERLAEEDADGPCCHNFACPCGNASRGSK